MSVALVVKSADVCGDDEDNCKEEFGGHLTLPIWGWCTGRPTPEMGVDPAHPNLGTPQDATLETQPDSHGNLLVPPVGHPSIQCEGEQTNK